MQTAGSETHRAAGVVADGWRLTSGHFGWMFLALAAAISIHTRLGTVHHDVLEIVMWANAPWTAGFWKHPPFLPWLFKTLHLVLPYGPEFLGILVAGNIALGAWATWRIARMALDPERAQIAFWLYLLLPFTTVMPLKLNHNAILVSVWPLAILAFLTALRRPTVLAGATLGMIAAIAMLAKYVSGLLLLAIFFASIASDRRRRFWSSATPYVAFAVFSATMTPHIIWFIEQSGSSMRYAVSSEKGQSLRAVIFGLETAGLMLPAIAAAWWLRRSSRGHGADPTADDMRFRRELLLVTILPWALTILATLVLALRGATAWAMPMASMVPVLLAGMLPRSVTTAPSMTTTWLRPVPIGVVALIGIVLAPVVGLAVRSPSETDPRAQLIGEVERRWRQLTDAPVRLVMGDTRLVSAASFGMRSAPLGWPEFDQGKALWVDAATMATTGAIALCRAADAGCASRARAVLAAHAPALGLTEQMIETRRRLGPIAGPPVAYRALMAVPSP